MRRWFAVALAILLPGCADNVHDGFQAYARGDYVTAEKLWTAAADDGSAAAQYDLGIMWEQGNVPGASRSLRLASDWYQRSARQGYTPAMVALAKLQLRAGYRPAAVSWLRAAARWNDQNARAMLAALGENVPYPDLYARREADEDDSDGDAYGVGYNLGRIGVCLAGRGC